MKCLIFNKRYAIMVIAESWLVIELLSFNMSKVLMFRRNFRELKFK